MENDWRKYIRFEKLIADLAATFVNLPLEKIDAHIEGTLGRLVEFLGFDRATLVQAAETGDQWFASHCWAEPGFQPHAKYYPGQELPWLYQALQNNQQPAIIQNVDELPQEAERDRAYLQGFGLRAIICIPLIARNKTVGFISFGSGRPQRSVPAEVISRMRLIGTIIAGALERKAAETSLQQAYLEVKKLKELIQAENVYLQKEVKLIHGQTQIIGRSPAIQGVLRQTQQVAGTNATVLIVGETGTGKELIAWAIHELSSRRNRSMVCINCAALPPALIESELFGHEKGAFTGAAARQVGRFEVADGSTIFLDEIGELPMEVQAKLLRVLQNGRLERLGSARNIQVDVRIIAATNRDLAKAVKEGRFRQDLYYRLLVFPIVVPPLRDRLEDIPLLVTAFVSELSKRMGKTIESVSRKDMEALQRYSWPGNLRELRNVIERAIILADGPILHPQVPQSPNNAASGPETLEEMERNHIIRILDRTGWRVSGERGAARILGINAKTLESRMKKLCIHRPPVHS